MARLPRITAYCLCGAFLRVRDKPEIIPRIIEHWQRMYHSGEGHRPVRGDIAAMNRKQLAREGIYPSRGEIDDRVRELQRANDRMRGEIGNFEGRAE